MAVCVCLVDGSTMRFEEDVGVAEAIWSLIANFPDGGLQPSFYRLVDPHGALLPVTRSFVQSGWSASSEITAVRCTLPRLSSTPTSFCVMKPSGECDLWGCDNLTPYPLTRIAELDD